MFDLESTGRSWRHRLTDEAAEFVTALEEHTIATGQPPVYARVSEALKKKYGIEVSSSTVGDHFRQFLQDHEIDFKRY